MTDSAADITLEEAQELQIDIVPLTITFKEEVMKQETTEDFTEFYQKLKTVDQLPVTSQPSPERYLTVFEQAQERGEEVLVLALSSGLSGTYESACLAREMSSYKEHITVVDTKQAILTQRMLVEYAVRLRDAETPLEEIVEKVNDVKDRMVVCGVINTLKYLKMGGRIPRSMAFIGEALNIKPVIILQDGQLKELAKKRGIAGGKKSLLQELTKQPVDAAFPVYFGYTLNSQKGKEFMEETIEQYGLENTQMAPIGGVIGTHVGPDGIALAFVREKA